jgi:alkylated DNA repair dioxygenase AlkB
VTGGGGRSVRGVAADGVPAAANAAVEQPAVDHGVAFERVWLDGASWVDVARGWVSGADRLYTDVRDGLAWRQGTMWRYEKYVAERRVSAWIGRGRPVPFPALAEAYRSLRRRYGVEFDGFGLSWYRDGNDAVAFHRDRDMRWLDDTVIAILTLGARRPWLVKSRHLPRTARILNDDRGDVTDFAPAGGDLLVLGGRAQADWLHAVPRLTAATAGRISVQWRWTSRRGRPETGPSYGAPRTFTR